MVESVDKVVADREKRFVPSHLRVLVLSITSFDLHGEVHEVEQTPQRKTVEAVPMQQLQFRSQQSAESILYRQTMLPVKELPKFQDPLLTAEI